jgi:hypothetical protein
LEFDECKIKKLDFRIFGGIDDPQPGYFLSYTDSEEHQQSATIKFAPIDTGKNPAQNFTSIPILRKFNTLNCYEKNLDNGSEELEQTVAVPYHRSKTLRMLN